MVHRFLDHALRWRTYYIDGFSKQKIIFAETIQVHKGENHDRFPGFSCSVEEIEVVVWMYIYGGTDRWKDGGVEALANLPISGRPLKADDEYTLYKKHSAGI